MRENIAKESNIASRLCRPLNINASGVAWALTKRWSLYSLILIYWLHFVGTYIDYESSTI